MAAEQAKSLLAGIGMGTGKTADSDGKDKGLLSSMGIGNKPIGTPGSMGVDPLGLLGKGTDEEKAAKVGTALL